MLNDNSKKPRTLINLIGIPFIIFSVYCGGIWFLAIMLFALMICIEELNNMLIIKGFQLHKVVFYFFIILFLFSLNFLSDNVSSVIRNFLIFDFFEINVFFYSLVLFLFCELYANKNRINIMNYLLNVFSINWIFWGILSIIKIRLLDNSIWTMFNFDLGYYCVLIMFLSIWVCDSFAFIIGSKFGKKKIFPKVSPKKTWLGALSGYVFTLFFLYMFFLLNEIYDFKIPLVFNDIILLSLIFGIISQYGDYVESYIKRKFNVKDSGKILQGHGGMLDRLDSLILVAPFFILYLKFFKGFIIL